MALGDVIARLSVELGLDTAAFEKGATIAEKRVAQAAKKIDAVGQSMVGLGQKLSIGVTAPLVAFGVTAVKAATESQQAIGQVDAALKSMGNAAGYSSTQLAGLATGIMRKSLYDDDDILRKVTANMLTFGNVAGENFKLAQQAAVDLSARMGTDLQASTLMVGKALNDPVKGINALKRAGIQFTAQQQEQIKAMAAVGNTAGAQKIMLAELANQFGGSAEAMRAADPFGAMKQSFADFQETVGGELLKAMPAITGAVTGMLEAFNALPGPVQQGAVVVGALAAAFGPLLIGLGAIVSATAPFTAAIGLLFAEGGLLAAGQGIVAGLTAAVGPWGLAIAAVAAGAVLIYQNWDKIAPVLTELWSTIQTTIGPPLMGLIDALKTALTELWNGPFGSSIKAVMPIVAQLGSIFLSAFGQTILSAIKLFAVTIGATFDTVAAAVRLVTALFDGTFKTVIVNAVRGVYEGVKNWLGDKLNAIWDGVKAKVNEVKGYFFGLYDAVVGHSYIPDMVDGIAAQMRRLDEVMVDKAKATTKKTADTFKALAAEVKPILDRLFPESAAANASAKDFASLEKARNAGVLSSGQFAAATERLQNETFSTEPANDNSALSESILPTKAVDLAALNDQFARLSAMLPEFTPRLGGFSDTMLQFGIDTDQLADQIGGAFTDLIMHGKSFGESMKGIFMNLFAKLLDSAGSNLIGSIFKAIPGFATGTPSAPRGIALVGERGPELVKFRGGESVTPSSSSRGGRGGNSVVIHADFRGADAGAVAGISAKLDQLDRSLEGRAIGAVADARERRIIR